jgi:NADPH:quinone reductase
VKAVQIHSTGGPEVLQYVDLAIPKIGSHEVLVEAHSIGVGMPDVLVRTGRYPWMPPLPTVLGIEMSGRILAVGNEVNNLKVGDPVFVSARELAFRGGCYAQYLAAPADAVYLLPTDIDLELAACLSNYQVAWHLLNSATDGYQFNSVLVWAAAGGVGTALVQLAKQAGKQVIGLASGPQKCDFVRAQGAAYCLDYQNDDILKTLQSLTNGRGVDLIFDPVGGHDFARNIDYLAPLGLVINFGMIEGPVHPNCIQAMQRRLGDSLGLRFFSMHVFDQLPEQRRAAIAALLPMLASGAIHPQIFERLALQHAKHAHELLDSGQVLGKLILKP